MTLQLPYPVAPPAPPVTPAVRSRWAVLGLGTMLGTLTGALIGLATSLLVLVPAAAASAGGSLALAPFAFVIGGALGVVVAVPTSLALVVARPWIDGDAWRGRLVSAVAAAAITAFLLSGLSAAWTAGFVVVCAVGAAAWTRVILGLPRVRKARRTPGAPW